MRKKIFLGDISSRDLPFQLRSDYIWTISLYALQAGGKDKLLLETRGYTAIQKPWTFAFHLDDDLELEAQGHRLRVEVLDRHVLIADADQAFSIDWEGSAHSVHNLVLQPQAV